MLMVLLTVLAVGLLGLSTIEIRTSSHNIAMQQARANARMAMVIAIGSLQKHAGPDQRVTGPSDFLASQNAGEPDLKHPHWTAVWKSVMPDGGPVIRRQGNGGGLRDRRSVDRWDVRDDLLAQLVSGNENGIRYTAEREEGDGANEEVLVGKGSVGGSPANAEAIVRAPKVTIGDSANGKVSGEYAWWVGDLGTKANVATADHFAEKSGSTIRRLQIAQDFSVAAASAEDTKNEDRARFVSPREFGLHTGGDPKAATEHFHDLTTDSESVLADVRDGGLKKDLTAYLLGNGNVSDLPDAPGIEGLGVSDSDHLIGPQNKKAASFMADGGEASRFSEVSPSFQLLRDWAQRSTSTQLSTRTVNPDYAETRPRDEGKQTAYGDHNLLPVEYKNRTQSDVAPVLVESSLYYNLSYYDAADDPDPRHRIGLRLHLYPRVALWNPYNVSIKVGASMMAMQINGAKEIEVTLQDNRKQIFKMCWGRISNAANGYSGARRGTHYFQLEGTTIGPGETIVFSPAGNRPYDIYELSSNLLTPNLPPDPSRSFFMDKRPDNEPPNPGPPVAKHVLFDTQQSRPPNPAISDDRLLAAPREWREVVGNVPSGNIQAAGYTQSDDYWMFWKPFPPGARANNLGEFNSLPHGHFVSCAFQYGDEDELPVQWSNRDPVPFQKSDGAGVTRQTPDRRTRDGFRLRWFREHPSNIAGSGSLKATPHLQDAPIASWNMRSSYSFRSSHENVTDVAPHYFGVYTRDLFDDAVSWNNLMPRGSSGSQLGDPFDQPVAGTTRILFDVPRTGAEVVSLGAFQHLKFSEFVWHPTYAFGNSLADPRIERSMTQPDRSRDINSREGGWNRDSIGYATDGRSRNDDGGASDADNWAYTARGMLEHVMKDQNTIFDLSYELNHSLWDRFFLSTGSSREKGDFAKDPAGHPLPNGRLRPVSGSSTVEDDIVNFHRAASALTVDGGFNVNSTSVGAWEALLLSSLGVQGEDDAVTFPRIFNLPGGTWNGEDATARDAWTGQRALNRGEVKKLAQAIVEEVRLRGPFLSMSDFVNRRLREDETGKMGALEAALKRSGVNASFRQAFPLDNSESLPDYRHTDNIKDPTRVEQTLKPDSSAWGALGNVTQADLLQSLGPVLSARSDTFVIRTYGSSLDPDGKVLAEAWCEAVVQRTPVPLSPDDTGLNPDISKPVDFGRTFEVKRFRWLHRDEV